MSLSDVITVYVSIGNSDDKLTQRQWADFASDIDFIISDWAARILGRWVSDSVSEYQNACWGVQFFTKDIDTIKEALKEYRVKYNQDSIAWAVAETEFI
jgi:zona occludens toxin (predicted ATPase)